MLFIYYPKCSTCQKAKKWLDEHSIEYTERHIVEDNPTYDELKQWYEKGGFPLKKFFNTSGLLYKEMQFEIPEKGKKGWLVTVDLNLQNPDLKKPKIDEAPYQIL